ncbi:MAG TPA: hypothetical protein ENH19_01440 [Actinobacteria bacterium]|nr:hypothetical protein [Actinomycetes bacterium]HEX21300.1 hypothetical protein [Actinomycetota bacterium]
MDSIKIEMFRNILKKEKKRVQAEIGSMEKENREVSQDFDSAGDNNFEDQIGDSASITFERERDFSLQQNRKDILRQIEIAIDSIDSGTYGICSRCHEPINERRLKALPYVEYCINCKKEEENY